MRLALTKRQRRARRTLEKMHGLIRRYNLDNIALGQEGSLYVASAVGEEAVSQGETIDETLDNLGDVLEIYFEDKPIPPRRFTL